MAGGRAPRAFGSIPTEPCGPDGKPRLARPSVSGAGRYPSSGNVFVRCPHTISIVQRSVVTVGVEKLFELKWVNPPPRCVVV